MRSPTFLTFFGVVISVSVLAESGAKVGVSAGELRKAASEFSPIADFAQTAKDYEERTQHQNKILQNLKDISGHAEAPPPTRVPAAAADFCSSVDSFAAFKACIGEWFDKLTGTPPVAKELPK